MSVQKIKLLVVDGAVLALFIWIVMTQGPLASVKVTFEQVLFSDEAARIAVGDYLP